MSYRAMNQCRGSSGFLSLPFSLNALCHRGTAILPLSRSLSFICPCVTVQLQCASPFLWEVSLGSQCVGEDLRLAPHLSVAYLNHAHPCHPSHCCPISLSAVTCNKISLFHLALPCFTLFFRTKGHFSDCHPDDDWQGTEVFVALIHLKFLWKWTLAA